MTREAAETSLTALETCTAPNGVCLTCGDVALPMCVIALEGFDALVEDDSGAQCSVALEFVPDAQVGDTLLVHGGAAIARLATNSEV